MANSKLVKYVCVKWWRRYWIFFALAIIVLVIQGLLAYNFYSFNSFSDEEYALRGNTGRSKGNVQQTNDHSQQRSNIYQEPLVSRYLEDYAVDDEDSPSNLFERAGKDSSSRNGPLKDNFDQHQNLVAKVIVRNAKDSYAIRDGNSNARLKNLGGSSNVAAIGDALSNMGVNKSYENLKLNLEELDFKPWCNISTREAISAIHRAKTQKCKQEIANISCLIQNSSLYPTRLPRYCPTDDDYSFKNLGCFRDETKRRILSGSFVRLSDNSPRRCVDQCLRSGYQYAGVQYSNECFCGKSQPPDSAKLPESKCDRACPKSPSIQCGGFLAMNVFRTGLPKFAKRELVIPPKWSSPRNVRVVFLLTVNGRALRQVKRLLKALYHKRHYFYIHVDSRQDYLYRELLPLEEKLPNVRLSRRRLSTIWGGASLLKMLLGCISDLLDIDGWKWDYVINLSESDFPIKSLEKLEMFLTANKGMNFVKSHGQDTQRFIAKQGLDKSFYECDTHMWRLGDRPLPWGIRMDGGSDWIALNRDFCSYVTSKLGKRDELLEGLKTVFQYTLLPAESFFHTVLHNSAFCEYIVDNNLHITNWKRKQGCKCQYKHIVDWCGCSPNDFKLEDWPRIQSTEDRPFFFARKFEPSVCQSIIEQVERWITGPREALVPSTFSYWQNEYHYQDRSPPSNDAYLSVFSSFGRLGVKQLREAGEGSCLPTFHQVLEANLYFEDDDYKGTLILYEAFLPKIREPVVLETQVRPIHKFTVHKAIGPLGSLKHIQVGSDFDQKEQVFRNFGRILGPFSDPVAVHRWGAVSQAFPVTFVWVDPIGIVAGSYEIRIEPGTSQVLNHKPTFRQPLRAGIWSLLLMKEWVLGAEVQFLVVPLSTHEGQPISQDKARTLHDGPSGQPYVDLDFSQVATLLSTLRQSQTNFANKNIGNSLHETNRLALSNSGRYGSDLESWIDSLVAGFWSTQTTCFKASPTHATGGALCPGLDLERCQETTWSSLSPDPKSEITKVDSISGRLR